MAKNCLPSFMFVIGFTELHTVADKREDSSQGASLTYSMGRSAGRRASGRAGLGDSGSRVTERQS